MCSSISLATQLYSDIWIADTSSEGSGDIGSAMRDIWEYLQAGGFFMLVIGICSLFALTIVLYKALTLKRRNIIADDTVMALRAAMDLDNRSGKEALRSSLQADDTPLARIASAAASPRLQNREEAVAAAQNGARSQMVKLEGGISALDVVITIAPLLGLLGTAAGLVGVFGTLGDSAEGMADTDPKRLAAGIAQALGTTIAGLVVAVPTVIAHTYFTKKIERFAVEMEGIVGALISWLHPGSDSNGGTTLPGPESLQSTSPLIGDLADSIAVASGRTELPQRTDPTP